MIEIPTKDYIEALKTQRDYLVEELETYKKAFELACATIAYSSPRMDEPYFYVKQYLQKARNQ